MISRCTLTVLSYRTLSVLHLPGEALSCGTQSSLSPVLSQAECQPASTLPPSLLTQPAVTLPVTYSFLYNLVSCAVLRM